MYVYVHISVIWGVIHVSQLLVRIILQNKQERKMKAISFSFELLWNQARNHSLYF